MDADHPRRLGSVSMNILVVEDETAIADFVQRGLEAEGYAVACAADGLEGEQQALEDDVDLVVLDLMLPGRDGLSVLDSIREPEAVAAGDRAHRARRAWRTRSPASTAARPTT